MKNLPNIKYFCVIIRQAKLNANKMWNVDFDQSFQGSGGIYIGLQFNFAFGII